MAMTEFLGRFEDDAIALANGDNESPVSASNVAAIAEWWNRNNCAVMDWAESGLRGLGLEGLANRQRSFKAASGCESVLPSGYTKEYGPGDFPGGQCPGSRYEIVASWTQSSPGFEGTATNDLFGPIEGLQVIPNPNFGNSELLQVVGRDSQGNENRITISSANNGRTFQTFQVDSITVLSGPDNCGDRDGGGPVYPPAGNLPPPPSVGDTFGSGQDIPGTVPIGGNDVPITFEFGPPEFLGKDGIRVPVNGVPIDISPDGGIDVPGGLDSDESPVETIDNKLDEILENLEQEIGGDLTITSCTGATETASYLGVGLQGLNAMYQTGFALQDVSKLELCPLEGEVDLEDAELLGTSVPFTEGEVKIVSLPDDAEEVYIEITGNPPGLRVFKLAGNESEARYGFWSIVYDNGNDNFSEAPTEIFTRMATMSLQSGSGRPRSVRVSLKKGLGYSLFIQRKVS